PVGSEQGRPRNRKRQRALRGPALSAVSRSEKDAPLTGMPGAGRTADTRRSRFSDPLNRALASIDQLTGGNRDVTCEKLSGSNWNKRALLPRYHSCERSLPRSNPIEATLFDECRD